MYTIIARGPLDDNLFNMSLHTRAEWFDFAVDITLSSSYLYWYAHICILHTMDDERRDEGSTELYIVFLDVRRLHRRVK